SWPASSTRRPLRMKESTAAVAASARRKSGSPSIAQDLAVYVNVRIGPDHLQVEHDAAELHCFDHVAQDVHDVLRLYSSKLPGKDDEIERLRFDLHLLPGSDLIGDAVSELVRQ